MDRSTQSLWLDATPPRFDAAAGAAADRTGFRIGWDHGHHGLVPPAELLLEGTPVGQGWRAARAVYGGRTLAATRWVRQALALRTLAWRRSIAFDDEQVTPNYLSQIHVDRCPVLRQALGGAAGQPEAAVVERLNPGAGYAAGNLAVMSRRAALAREGVDAVQALRRARRAQAEGGEVDGLDAGAWLRLSALAAFSTPLPYTDAVRVPLALLPPNRVRLLNAAQGLQALLTLAFATPGWAARTRALGELLPTPALRQDHHLLVGAIAARVLDAGPGGVRREALEDAWLHDRVQRRWEQLALGLGEAAAARLVDAAAERGLAGVRLLNHAPAQATDGWALESGGRPAGAAPRPRLPARAGGRWPLRDARPAAAPERRAAC